MESFGATLRKEREERGLTLDTVAAVIGIDRNSLSALERDEFDHLPDHEKMLRGLRAYADCLQVDAELMIEDYERERELCLQRLADAVAEQAVEPDVETSSHVEVAEDVEAHPRRSHLPQPGPRPIVVLIPVMAMVALGIWWLLPGEAPVEQAPPVASEVAPAEPADVGTPTSTAPATSEPEAPAPVATKPVPAAPPVVVGQGMAVTEYGVGTGVRDRRLVGKRDRFDLGSQAWFWTRVEGGSSGDRIEHVWLHEGVEAARIPLGIGGSRWRTQSSKTLRSPGAWTVEARDSAGRVLARSEFVSVP